MGREHCFERFDVERAKCCLETRNEITDGDRQSPEASDLAKCLSWNIYCNEADKAGKESNYLAEENWIHSTHRPNLNSLDLR